MRNWSRMEWTGRAPAPNGSESALGLVRTRSTTMPCSTIRAVATIGVDMGKNTLHMIGLDSRGAIVLREKVSRGRISWRLANLPPCLIGIEAGMATHYVARELAALGHDVKQVPATYAKPFRQGHKNDFRDAHAVAEAVQRPTTRFVPAKTDEQLDLQALHRARRLVVRDHALRQAAAEAVSETGVERDRVTLPHRDGSKPRSIDEVPQKRYPVDVWWRGIK